MPRSFIVVSGLPGSGKSTLARQLATVYKLPVIDKDDILERLFEERGPGDAAWRRKLSRESDVLFQTEAEAAHSAILVSFWRLSGMPADSGTPTEWLLQFPNLMHVRCVCAPEIAAQRFLARRRHRAHLDSDRSPEQLLENLRELDCLPPLDIAPRIDVNTEI